MARCYCRWRNLLICLCTPCICLVLLVIYIGIMVCSTMNQALTVTHQEDSLKGDHFMASGMLRNKSFAPLPKSFWKLQEDALWNKLQQDIDRQFNYILQPQNKTVSESSFLLSQSFSNIINLDSTKKHVDNLPKPLQDFVGHMTKRDYSILIQPDAICGAGAKDEREPPLLLLAIKTTELNFKNRQAIRQTWGKEGWVEGHIRNSSGERRDGGYIRRVFLLGKENPKLLGVDLSELLQMEGKHYGDILQWDFSETFFNLTLKDVLFWEWFSHHCGHTIFVFKGDDDVFVNMPNMITYLHEQLRRPQTQAIMGDFMIGDVISAAHPDQDLKSKYFVPQSFYSGFYPAYAGGGGVVYSGQLTKRLHDISKKIHLFPIDDVYVGMCMVRLNAQTIHHPAFLTFDFPEKEEKAHCRYHTILVVHKRSPNQIIELWSDMMKTNPQCWNTPLRHTDKELKS